MAARASEGRRKALHGVFGGMVDAYTLDCLGPVRKGDYGKYRLWGSVGWASSAVSTGLVMDHIGFKYNFAVYGASTTLMLLLCIGCLPARTLSEQCGAAHGETASRARFRSLLDALCHWRVALVLAEMLALGFGIGVAEKLVFAFVVHEVRAAVCGVASLLVRVLTFVPPTPAASTRPRMRHAQMK